MVWKKAYLEYIFASILISLFCLVVLSNSNPLYFEPGRDGGFFMYVGQEMLKGKTLYVDVWDSKGPVIFFINALGMWMGKGTRWGIWALEFLFLFGASLFSFSTMKRQWGTLPAIFGITAGLMSARILFGAGNFVEQYALMFTWIALFAFYQSINFPQKKQYPFIIGTMLALNFFLRANNIGTIAVLVCVWFLNHWKQSGFIISVKKTLGVFLGVLIVVLPITLFFISTKSVSDMYSASILYNLEYSFTTRPNSNSLSIFYGSLLPGFRALGNWAFVGLIGFSLALAQLLRQIKFKKLSIFDLALVLIWPVEILASSVSGRGYGHYFICWLPALTLLSALLFHYIDRYVLAPNLVDLLNRRLAWLTYIVCIGFVIFSFQADLILNLKSFNRILFHRGQGVEIISLISEYIRENTQPNDLVLVWGGQSGINVMADRSSIDAFLYYPLTTNAEEGQKIQAVYLDQIIKQKPTLIIDGYIHSTLELPAIDSKIRAKQELVSQLAQNTQKTLDYISKNYVLETVYFDYGVYRIKSTATP